MIYLLISPSWGTFLEFLPYLSYSSEKHVFRPYFSGSQISWSHMQTSGRSATLQAERFRGGAGWSDTDLIMPFPASNPLWLPTARFRPLSMTSKPSLMCLLPPSLALSRAFTDWMLQILTYTSRHLKTSGLLTVQFPRKCSAETFSPT